jgi:lactoylglutathione lyase
MPFQPIAQQEMPMKRFHVHVGVDDLERSIAFYSGLFGAAPTVRKEDYAKWMLDEPRVNFAISRHGDGNVGINHLGLQAETADELAAIRARFEAADAASIVDEPGVQCCYAKGDKHWLTDPQGIAWEAFHTLEAIPVFGMDAASGASACCATTHGAPAATQRQGSCCT